MVLQVWIFGQGKTRAGVDFGAWPITLKYRTWWTRVFGTSIPHYVGAARHDIYPLAIPMLVRMLLTTRKLGSALCWSKLFVVLFSAKCKDQWFLYAVYKQWLWPVSRVVGILPNTYSPHYDFIYRLNCIVFNESNGSCGWRWLHDGDHFSCINSRDAVIFWLHLEMV